MIVCSYTIVMQSCPMLIAILYRRLYYYSEMDKNYVRVRLFKLGRLCIVYIIGRSDVHKQLCINPLI